MLSYVRDNLAGALDLMLGRVAGLTKLDTSLDGFWRSFAAFILVLPFALLALISEQRLAAMNADGQPVPEMTLPLELGVLLIDWLAFPIVFALISRPLGLSSRYVPFIVARNWATVVVGGLMAAVHALFLVGLVPGQAALFILFAFIAVALRFSYMVTRLALDVPMRTALPIVAFDFLLSLTIWSAFSGAV